MRRIRFLCVAAVLLWTGTIRADLDVYEYVPGQKVTLDTNTGHYWYWNLADFSGTYALQKAAIAGLGTYGNIAGGWHMATESEMFGLWGLGFPGDPIGYGASEIAANFAPVWTPIPPGPGAYIQWAGAYDSALVPAYHQSLTVYADSITGDSFKDPWPGIPFPDEHPSVGAWVTTDAPVVPVVPVPGAVLLGGLGALLVGGLRRHRSL